MNLQEKAGVPKKEHPLTQTTKPTSFTGQTGQLKSGEKEVPPINLY